jgi:hypothetical protein
LVCEYHYDFNENPSQVYNDGAGTVEIAIISDPNDSVYLQMADALIQAPFTNGTQQPSPPLGDQSIEDGNGDQILVSLQGAYALDFNADLANFNSSIPSGTFAPSSLQNLAQVVVASLGG